MSGAIRAIPKQDVNLIQSAQVITCLADVAKELLENALDARASKVSLKFTNYGIDLLEVSDDGSGIPEEDYDSIVVKHATSKLSTFEDLESLTTLGFRGEALSSLCALSSLSMTTCTKSTFPRGTFLTFNHNGTVRERKTVSATIGTIVRVEALFESLPVRRKDFVKNAKRELLNVAKLLQAHAAIRGGVRIEAVHLTGKNRLHLLGNNGTTGSNDLRRNVSDLFGSQLYRVLVPLDTTLSFQSTHHRRQGETVVRLHGLISNLQKEYGQRPERQLTYINSRPCGLPKILRTVNEVCSSLGANRQPFVLINLEMPPDSYDVNVSPDKRTIFLHDEQIILQHLRDAMSEMFSNDSRDIPLGQTLIDQESARPKFGLATKDSVVAAKVVEQAAALPQEIDLSGQEEVPEDEPDMSEADHGMNNEHNGERCNDISSIDASDEESEGNIEAAAEGSQTTTTVRPSTGESARSNLTLRNGLQTTGTSLLKRKRDSEVVQLSTSNTGDDNRQRSLEIESRNEAMDAMPNQVRNAVNAVHTLAKPTDPEIERIGDRHEIDIPPAIPMDKRTDRFLHRLERFERSSPSSHVHDLEMIMDTTNSRFEQGHWDHDRSTNDSSGLKDAGVEEANELAERTLSLNVSKSDFFDMEVIGQFNLGFILVKLGHELFIVDQHASDEKSNYERLLRETVIQSQKMARPQELDLSAMERLSISEHIETLSKNGFEVVAQEDDAGESTYMLHALPVTKKTTFGATDLIEILHLLMEGSSPENVRCTKARRMFASRACRSSIMIGTALTIEKMQEIVWHLGEMDAPWNCPHGRPTMRHLMTIDDMPSFMSDYK